MKTVYQTSDKQYRICQHDDDVSSYDDMAGDMFKPEANPTMTIHELMTERHAFEQRIDEYGVIGLTLERWNPSPGIGYEVMESMFGILNDNNGSKEDSLKYLIALIGEDRNIREENKY